MCECPVCFEPLEATIASRPPCGHEICLGCLLLLRERRCPLCRADLGPFYPRHVPYVPLTLHIAQPPRLPPPPPLLGLSDDDDPPHSLTRILDDEVERPVPLILRLLRMQQRVPAGPSPLRPDAASE